MGIRLGRIGYINCYPVYGALDSRIVTAPCEMVTGTPSELNDLLAVGELDISVVSAVEYARHSSEYRLLPDLAISCDGPVRSVALFSKRPAAELHGCTILVSASSRTSVLLLKLLCAEVWRVSPRFAEARAEAGDIPALRDLPHDAVLVIGDAALELARDNTYAYHYDLGEEWKRWTGLPFVFAVWAARLDTGSPRASEVHQALLASREWGLRHLEELATRAARTTGLPVHVCLEYLGGLDYALSYRHIEGLTSFLRRLVSRDLIQDGAMSFLSVA